MWLPRWFITFRISELRQNKPPAILSWYSNELIYFNQEERLSRIKNDSGIPYLCLEEIKKIVKIKLDEKTFDYINNREYTPKNFASERIGINPDDYIEITSYNHHSFYQKCILEIPANWNDNFYLNLPISDFKNIINNNDGTVNLVKSTVLNPAVLGVTELNAALVIFPNRVLCSNIVLLYSEINKNIQPVNNNIMVV